MLSAVISSIYRLPALRLALQPVHQWYVQPGPLVLGSTPLNSSTRIADRDRTVSRRSEPSSRTTLIGEQPNLGPAPAPGCDEPTSRCQTLPSIWALGRISLLSPAYLLSVERWPFHSEPPDHYDRLSTLLDLSVSQSGKLMPLHSTNDFWPFWAYLRTPQLLFGRRPPQSNYPPYNVLMPDNGNQLDTKKNKRGISLVTHIGWRLCFNVSLLY